MKPETIKTVVKVIVACLVVGLVLAWFGITTENILENLSDTVVMVYQKVFEFVNWALAYIVLGAIVVVPVWLIYSMPGVIKKRRKRDGQ